QARLDGGALHDAQLVLAASLYRDERVIGRADEVVELACSAARQDDADRRRHARAGGRGHARDDRAHTLEYASGVGRARGVEQYDELVATVAAGQIARTEIDADRGGDELEDLVALQVTTGVVHLL